jgi:hypothetical protein
LRVDVPEDVAALASDDLVALDDALGRLERHDPDERLLAVGMADGVGLWDLERGRALAFLSLPMYRNVLFEPSGALLANGPRELLRWPIRQDPKTRGLLIVGPPQQLPSRG